MIPLGVTGLFLPAQVSVWRTELSKVVWLTLSGHLRGRVGGRKYRVGICLKRVRKDKLPNVSLWKMYKDEEREDYGKYRDFC